MYIYTYIFMYMYMYLWMFVSMISNSLVQGGVWVRHWVRLVNALWEAFDAQR